MALAAILPPHETALAVTAIPPPGSATGPVVSSATVARLRAAGCVFAEDEAALLLEASGSVAELEDLVARRVSGLPLEHLLGWAEFAGLRIAVGPGVFVPRRRTEFLATEALRLGLAASHPVVVDLCCGSGAIAAVLADGLGGGASGGLADGLNSGRGDRRDAGRGDRRDAGRATGREDVLRAGHVAEGLETRRAGRPGDAEIYAADLDPVCVQFARINLGPSARVFQGDLFDALPTSLRGRITVLTCNTPYVPSAAIATMPAEARLHEPALALDGGTDGLELQRRAAASAFEWLAPGGTLLVEVSEAQAGASAALFEAAGLQPRILTSHEHDATIVTATRH